MLSLGKSGWSAIAADHLLTVRQRNVNSRRSEYDARCSCGWSMDGAENYGEAMTDHFNHVKRNYDTALERGNHG